MNSSTRRRLAGLGVAALSLATFVAPAQAGIGANPADRGPLTERFGFFPEYYRDGNGLKLQLCVDPIPECGAVVLPNPAAPRSFPANFPDELFYWSANATLGTGIGLVLAQEAVFANAPGTQAVFGRVRVTDRDDELSAGVRYRITTPYGQFDTTGGVKKVVDQDIGCPVAGCATPANFGDVGASLVGPDFLTWDASAPAPPDGFVGDAATGHRVTGADPAANPADASINPVDPCPDPPDPLDPCTPPDRVEPPDPAAANYFRIDRIDAAGDVIAHVAQTPLFVVTGRRADDPAQPYLLASAGNAGGQPIADGPKGLTVTIRNGGSGDLTIATTALTAASPDFAVTGGSCAGATVLPAGATQTPAAPNTTCTIDVAFDPSTAGAKSATLRVAEQGGGPAHDIALTGRATQPIIGADQGGLSFGVQPVGTTAPTMTATIRNTGDAALRVNGATLSGSQAGDFRIVADACGGALLAPSATCAIDVHFTPSATSVRNASLDVASAAGPRSLSLSGVGSAPGPGASVTIIQQGTPGPAGPPGPAAGTPTAGSATSASLAPLSLRRLGTARRIKRATARRRGIRLRMELTAGTEVLRINVYRRGGGKLRLLSSGFKAPGRTGTYTVGQRHATLRRALGRRGTYEVHVTPGRSPTDLGATAKFAFKVV